MRGMTPGTPERALASDRKAATRVRRMGEGGRRPALVRSLHS